MPIGLDTVSLELYRPFIGAVVFLLGAMVGSFLNVVAHRLPKMMEKSWRDQCTELLSLQPPAASPAESYNLAFPASHCPNCRHEIRWWENIPLLSYLWLRGKCSGCKMSISLRYPVIELLTALLSVTVIAQLGATASGVSALLLTWSLIALALIDFDTQMLPDDVTLPLLWVGLLLNLFAIHTPLEDAVMGAVAGYLSLWSVYWLYKLFTGKIGMGHGDFKLLAVFGAWLGWQALPVIILLSSVVGSVIGIGLILLKGRDSQIPIPFGPYLAIAGWVVLVAQNEIANVFPVLFI